MNDITKNFLLAGDKWNEMHLRDPTVGIYLGCGPFTKHKQRIQKFMETGDTNYIYRNDIDKAWAL